MYEWIQQANSCNQEHTKRDFLNIGRYSCELFLIHSKLDISNLVQTLDKHIILIVSKSTNSYKEFILWVK